MEAHDSVAVLIYHTEWHSLLVVRQFRPAVYASNLRRANGDFIEFSSGSFLIFLNSFFILN